MAKLETGEEKLIKQLELLRIQLGEDDVEDQDELSARDTSRGSNKIV